MTVEGVGKIDSFIADVRRNQKLLRNRKPGHDLREENDFLRRELAENVYPCFIALAKETAEIDDAMGELVDQQESYMQPELVAVVMGALRWAVEIADQAKELTIADELKKQRLHKSIKEFETIVELAIMGVETAALDEEEGEEEEGPLVPPNSDPGPEPEEKPDEEDEEDEADTVDAPPPATAATEENSNV